MPLTPFGKWTPCIGKYEAPENVTDINAMFPCVRGYEPWWGVHTARPALPVSANNAMCLYGSASPHIGMMIGGNRTFFANVPTATSVWFTSNARLQVASVTFTNSGSNYVIRTSATPVNFASFQKANLILVALSGSNDGTYTVWHGENSYTAYPSLSTTADFVKRIYLSSPVTPEYATASIALYTYFDTDIDGWQFAAFRSQLIAANRNAFPVAGSPMTLGSETAKRLVTLNSSFKAGAVGVVNEFVVLGDLVEGISFPHTRNKVWWSAIGDPHDWVVDTATQCGNATLPGSSGRIMGIVSGEQGMILCGNEIYRMLYIGPPSVFQIELAFANMGILGKKAWATYGDKLFLATTSGFKMIMEGSVIYDIGKEDGIDEFFSRDLDVNTEHRITCEIDGQSTRVFWSYESTIETRPNMLLCYDWKLNKWSKKERQGTGLVHDLLYSDIADDLQRYIGIIDNVNSTAFRQTTMPLGTPATSGGNDSYIESAEIEHAPGYRAFISGLRVIADGSSATPSVAAFHRNSMFESATITTFATFNAHGEYAVHLSGRYVRYRLYYGHKNFSNLLGIQVKATSDSEI